MSSLKRESIVVMTKEGHGLTSIGNHERIATLVSMYDMHEVPETILLQGSVADIVNEEAIAWHRSLKRAKIFRRGLGTSSLVRKMLAADNNTSNESDLELDKHKPVYLCDVSRIIRIFDNEDWDFLGVLVDERTTQHERMAYHRQVGRYIWKNNGSGIIRFFTVSPDCCLSTVYVLFRELINHIFERGIAKKELDDEKEDKVHILLSIAFVATMRSREEGCEPLVKYVLWHDLLELAKDEKEKLSEFQTLKFFVGKRDAEVLTFNSLEVILHCSQATKAFLYQRAIKWIADDVSPIDLGLDCIVEDKAKSGDIWYVGLGYFIKTYSRGVITELYGTLPLQSIGLKTNVAKLELTLGRVGIVKTLLCLLHHIGRDETNNTPKVDRLTRAIERYLK